MRGLGFIAAGPRSPRHEAPYTYVTTKGFLADIGFDTLRELPDIEAIEEADLLSKRKLLYGEIIIPECRAGDDEGKKTSIDLDLERLGGRLIPRWMARRSAQLVRCGTIPSLAAGAIGRLGSRHKVADHHEGRRTGRGGATTTPIRCN
ncbi:Segregation and condensation protein B [Hyphomicrobiales bacterium]|nr:Segregation and condensation protein B [Hyphomicrobiales bacterium]CAH1692481.1 Segregation and condensation protein B [Hyphomicrobiales bacterium]